MGLLIKSPIMKYLVLFALLALAYAEPEAAPKADADASVYYHGGYVRPYYYGYYGYHPYHLVGKREAEAAPEADADADASVYYGGYVRPYYYGYGGYYPYHFVGKREAEAA